jgi:hypothetical protein
MSRAAAIGRSISASVTYSRGRFLDMNQRALDNDGGRPTLFRAEYAEQARKYKRGQAYEPEVPVEVREWISQCQFGATIPEVAHFFDVTPTTISNWQLAHPEFFEAMRLGRQASDERVERSFYQRAIGYDVKTTRTVSKTGDGSVTETIEHLPGDVTAQMKWLSNRRPKQWRGDIPDAEPPRSSEEIKAIILGKLMEWGLKVVPADAPSLESVEGGRLASPASQVPITKAPT